MPIFVKREVIMMSLLTLLRIALRQDWSDDYRKGYMDGLNASMDVIEAANKYAKTDMKLVP